MKAIKFSLNVQSVVFSRTEFQCGERYSAVKDRKKSFFRVVGGKEAKTGDFPWQASLQKRDRHYCGGSVISKRWILTAAHCLKPLTESVLPSVKVLVGSMYHDNRDKTGNFYGVDEVLIHESFDPKNFINDIGLIKLSKEITFSNSDKGAVAPACLPTANAAYTGTATVSGWGSLKWKGKFPPRLQALDMNLLDDNICKQSSSAQYDMD
ncbi:transmembrane protease serine 9-like protein, partial [Leptotrombidium deliense]